MGRTGGIKQTRTLGAGDIIDDIILGFAQIGENLENPK
jgi:hypothetical protein